MTERGGGSVLFGVDPAAGPSTLWELYAGSGGITELLATGANSQIVASGPAINLPASGLTLNGQTGGGDLGVPAPEGPPST